MSMGNNNSGVRRDASEDERRRNELDALVRARSIQAMQRPRQVATTPSPGMVPAESRVPVTVRELAERLKMERSACRRYVLSLGYQPVKQRTASSGFQEALTLTPEQADEIYARRHAEGYC